jgi:hypothetical protein
MVINMACCMPSLHLCVTVFVLCLDRRPPIGIIASIACGVYHLRMTMLILVCPEAEDAEYEDLQHDFGFHCRNFESYCFFQLQI